MSTELLRDLLKDIMARDLQSLDMVTPLALAIITEVPRESKDMAMEVTTRDLLSLVMAITMDMVVIATSMSTDHTLITRLRFIIHKHITMDMARGLLSLDMALLMSMLSRRTMDMATQSLM